MTDRSLTVLRESIDRVDEQIINLLAERFSATASVGELKAKAGLAAVDETRERRQMERFRQLAESKGLNPELVVRVFRTIIDEVVSNHRAKALGRGR